MTVMNSVTSLTNYLTNFHYLWWRFRNSQSPFLICTLVWDTMSLWQTPRGHMRAEHISEQKFWLFLFLNSCFKHVRWTGWSKEDISASSRGVILNESTLWDYRKLCICSCAMHSCVQVCWFINCTFQKSEVSILVSVSGAGLFLNWLETGISFNLLISIDVKVLLQLNYRQLILKMNFRLLLCVHWSAVINKLNCWK